MFFAFAVYELLRLSFKSMGLMFGAMLWLVVEAFVVEFLLLLAMLYLVYAPLYRLGEGSWPPFPYVPSLRHVGRVTFWA